VRANHPPRQPSLSSSSIFPAVTAIALAALLASPALIDNAGAQAPEGDAAGELPVLLRSFAEPETPVPPFEDGEFLPREGETIAFLGGTNTFDQQRHPVLETTLYLAWPERKLRVRNLAWQGDTLFHQARPKFFYTAKGDPGAGSSPDSRERTEPGIIFVNFGKIESLDGMDRFPEFLITYARLLDQLSERTRRLVVVLPTPFFPVGPAAKLAGERNATLNKFVVAMREVANQRQLLTVDTFSPLLKKLDPDLSTNGVHLSEAGHNAVAELVADQLEIPSPSGEAATSSIGQSLKQSIERKNYLWNQYYHPTNWAFLYGDRQHVPASRDHIETSKRWLIEEVDALPPLIAETEADIYRYAAEVVNPSKP